MVLRKIKCNRAKCRKCGDVIESKSRHDRRTCSCGAISVDGGTEYFRREGSLEDIEELSEYEKIPVSIERKPTGIKAFNGMMYVGDTVIYEDGWLTFTSQIVEVEGKFGFILEDEEFVELQEYLLYPEKDPAGLDFEIISTKATKCYPAVFSRTQGSEISVVFPDLDVATSGIDIFDAMHSAQELLGCVLAGLEEDGQLLPPATDKEKVAKDLLDRVILIVLQDPEEE